MESWRVKAIEMLPELEEDTNPSDDPMRLWIEIAMEFDDAYKEPRNEDLIQRIYAYADWCLQYAERSPKAADDPLTCVAVCFYEHIPTREVSRLDMPRWFTRDDIVGMKQTFSYHLNPDEYKHLLELFPPPESGRGKKKRAHDGRPKN